MIPFLHIGPITIPTFGLMVATALLVSAYVLQADFYRRRAQLEEFKGYKPHPDEGFVIIGVAGVAPLPCAGSAKRTFRRSLAPTFQPLRLCVVWRIPGRHARFGFPGAPLAYPAPIFFGHLLDGCGGWLRYRTNWLPAFW